MRIFYTKLPKDKRIQGQSFKQCPVKSTDLLKVSTHLKVFAVCYARRFVDLHKYKIPQTLWLTILLLK